MTVIDFQPTWTLGNLPVVKKISEAKAHIRLAEQADQRSLEHYVIAGNLLAAANHGNGVSYAELAKGVGKSTGWICTIVKWFRETDHEQGPFVVANQEKRARATQNSVQSTERTIGQAPDRPATRRVPRKTAPAIEQAVASAVLDAGKTLKAAAQAAGVGSEQIVKTAVAREEGRREALAELLDAAATKNFTEKGKLAIDAAIRIHKARLEAENKIYLDKQIDFHIKRLKTEHLPKWEEDAKHARLSREQYQKLVNSHKPPLTKVEYQMILLTAHEDNSASLETRKRAMIILNNKKFVLTGE